MPKPRVEIQENPTYAALCEAVGQTGISQRHLITIAEKFFFQDHQCPRTEKRSRFRMLEYLKTNAEQIIPIINKNKIQIAEFQHSLPEKPKKN